MYQPKTGARCGCRPGVWRDNCPSCEGTGWVVDFAAIRRATAKIQAERLLTIQRDGEVVATVTDVQEAVAWFHDHTAGSYDHALRHEGYRVLDADGAPALEPYSGRPR